MKFIYLTSFLLFSIAANAGIAEFTMHSRANCVGFNESISWHLGHSYWLRTESVHMKGGKVQHIVGTKKELTWRSAAYHVGDESLSGWTVQGIHYGYTTDHKQILWAITSVTDCSIYDGWWDH